MLKTLDELNGYEKGVIARALLGQLIKQGYLINQSMNDQRFEITIVVDLQQLRLMAGFCEESQALATSSSSNSSNLQQLNR